MTFAYAGRMPPRARAWVLWQTFRLHDSCRYQRLLIALDAIHHGDLPASHSMPGIRPELLAHLEEEST